MKNLKTIFQEVEKDYVGTRRRQENLKFFRGCDPIVDIGCGAGNFLVNDPNRCIGVDWNMEACRLVLKRNCRIVRGQACELPFKNASVQGILCSQIIEHLIPEDVYRLLKEINRVLALGGILVLESPAAHPGFYDNLTHIKPYNPAAILRYLCSDFPAGQRTFPAIDTTFKLRRLKWYRRPFGFNGYQLATVTSKTRWRWMVALNLLLNYLHQYYIRRPSRVAYTLILEKMR
ncbi:MAG: class I SAM-dependent methyltransferase [Desulfobacterales bacterium]|nr:MAG: class I SAM-dependent methyltransferase [Desulfobacterales bacterium]